jgi:hypothetical protein
MLVDMIFANAPCDDSSLLMRQSGQAGGFHDDLRTRKRPQRNRLVVGPSPHVRDRVPLDWNGTFLRLSETDVNLIFLDRGCLDKDTNSNEAIAVSRITQNDQIGLLEPG